MSRLPRSAAALLTIALLILPLRGNAESSPQEVKPYDPSLTRLAEVLGALTYLRGLCGEKDSPQWRARMQALLDAEGTTPTRKNLLAGAYNNGLQGYALSYRSCTPNAHVIIDRFLSEASRIAKTLENRYRAT